MKSVTFDTWDLQTSEYGLQTWVAGGRLSRQEIINSRATQAQDEVARYVRWRGMSLQEFRERKRFTTWKRFAKPIAIEESRRIFETVIDELIALGANPDQRKLSACLKRAVKAVDKMEIKHSCLGTIEGDDLLTEFQGLFVVCGREKDIPKISAWKEVW